MYQKKQTRWLKHVDFIVLDLLCCYIAFALAYAVRYGSLRSFFGRSGQLLTLAALVAGLMALTMLNNFKEVLKRGYMVEFGYLLQNAAVVYASLAVLLFALKLGEHYSRACYFLSLTYYLLFAYIGRIGLKHYLRFKGIPQSGRSLLIVTDSGRTEELALHIGRGNFSTFRLAGVALSDRAGTDGETVAGVPLVCGKADLEDYVRLNWVDEILLVLPLTEETVQLANAFMTMGITVHLGLDPLKDMLPRGMQEVTRMGGYDAITTGWNSASSAELKLKRLVDILGGIVGCIFTGLIALFVGPAIYLASPGPIIYKHKRIGKNGKVFMMYKFRSMVMNADELKAELMAQNRYQDGMMFKIEWDPRIIGNKTLPDGTRKTGIGEFIRRTSLDEFPQFFNVLKGDMSLVGTRPPTVDEWKKYENHHRARLAMKPGITGMWQVSGRSDITDFEEVVRLDTEYIANWSPLLDLKILLKTVLVVLTHKGSM